MEIYLGTDESRVSEASMIRIPVVVHFVCYVAACSAYLYRYCCLQKTESNTSPVSWYHYGPAKSPSSKWQTLWTHSLTNIRISFTCCVFIIFVFVNLYETWVLPTELTRIFANSDHSDHSHLWRILKAYWAEKISNKEFGGQYLVMDEIFRNISCSVLVLSLTYLKSN